MNIYVKLISRLSDGYKVTGKYCVFIFKLFLTTFIEIGNENECFSYLLSLQTVSDEISSLKDRKNKLKVKTIFCRN